MKLILEEKINKIFQPVIILGMHRSGTSLLSKIVENFGYFFGIYKDNNNESPFFVKLNDWMLSEANASWDNPYNFTLTDKYFEENIRKVLEGHLMGVRRVKFLGYGKFIKNRSIKHLNFKWGWKDPRTTFTIDIWKEIFPGAMILHIYRNPIDVAESLRKRERNYRENFILTKKMRIKEFLLKNKVSYAWSVRLNNIEEGIKLWEFYVTKALSLNKEFGNRILHLKYEDLISDIETNVRRIAEFLGVSEESALIDKVLGDISIDSSRKYSFIKNKELLMFYERIKKNKLIKALSYDKF
jgi:hypothetical protein